MVDQPDDRGFVKQVAAVLDATHDPLGSLVELEVQVDSRSARMNVHLGEIPPRARGRGGGLEYAHRLAQRLAARVASRVEVLDEKLEVHVTVAQGLNGGLTHPREQLAETQGR